MVVLSDIRIPQAQLSLCLLQELFQALLFFFEQ